MLIVHCERIGSSPVTSTPHTQSPPGKPVEAFFCAPRPVGAA